MNSELAKRLVTVERRMQRLERLAQASRVRFAQVLEQDHCLQEQMNASEQHRDELLVQVLQFEEAGRTQERGYFPLKARQRASDWEIHRRKVKREKHAVRRQRERDICAGYCRELRQALREQEDLQAQARTRYELDQAKDQIMTLF